MRTLQQQYDMMCDKYDKIKDERDQLKKDLLNLLPIARHAMKTMTVAYAEGFNEEHLATFIGTLDLIDELTAKYTEGK